MNTARKTTGWKQMEMGPFPFASVCFQKTSRLSFCSTLRVAALPFGSGFPHCTDTPWAPIALTHTWARAHVRLHMLTLADVRTCARTHSHHTQTHQLCRQYIISCGLAYRLSWSVWIPFPPSAALPSLAAPPAGTLGQGLSFRT